MKQQRLCLVRHGYYPDDPRSNKEVSALAEAGYVVDVICLRNKGQTFKEQSNTINIYRIPIAHKRTSTLRYFFQYGLSFLIFSILIMIFHLQHRYHCIQVATMPDFLVFSTFLPRLFNAKVLLDLHEPTPELWVTKYRDRWQTLLKLQTKIEQAAICYADATITVTDELRDRVIERGANGNKIFIVRNVCDEKMFSKFPQHQTSQKKNGFSLITHGSIEERYGHEELIRAAASLRHRIPNLHLEILGSGEHKTKLIDLSEKLHCLDIVEFTGFVSNNELVRRLRATNVGVIAMRSSPYSELIDTNKMYEYIVLKKPIIISRLAPVFHNFDDSCVKFFEPGNYEDLALCILEIYQDPLKGQTLVKNASQRYEVMRWKHSKRNYLNVVHKLLTRELNDK